MQFSLRVLARVTLSTVVIMFDFLGDAVNWVLNLIAAFGYVGLAFVVALESVFPPIPSEVILPLAGFLTAQGRMTFVGAVIASTVGSVLGALILYAVGYALGARRVRWLVCRYGCWVMVSEEDLDKAYAWFDRYGRAAVLIGRLAPLVRSLISIPAGVARMPLLSFIVFTTIGSGVWNALLIWAGWLLGENWEVVGTYQGYFGNFIVAALVVTVVWFLGSRLLRTVRPPSKPDQPVRG